METIAKAKPEEHKNKMALFGASFLVFRRDPAERKKRNKIKSVFTSAVKYSKIAAE